MSMKKRLIIVLVLIIFLVGCGKKEEQDEIVGTWDSSGFSYTFNDDKTGSYSTGDTELTFTYEDDGENITIVVDGGSNSSKYKYTVDGQELVFEDSFGNAVKYYKK